MASEEFRSSPEVRTGFVKGNTFGYRPVQYYVIDGQAIFEGDIVLDSVDGMERLVAEVINETGVAARGIVITGAQFRWPGGVVPFTIDPALPNVTRVNDAIAHWHNRTHIRLVARTNEQNFVTFSPGNGCSSPVGMRGGQQFITLAPGCDRGSVIHEIGHAVGLWHEQSREDRDRFIRILWQNIEAGREHNFAQHIADGDDVGPYDFGSIMHYPTRAFSRNNQPTIETLNGEAIGQRNGLSDGDVQAINFIYPIFVSGRLLSYGDAGTPGNVSGPVVVGFGGWLDFKFLFSGANLSGENRIYAVDQNGQLLSYGDAGTPGNVSSPVVVGFGGWLDFKFLFSGRNLSGENRIYAVVA
ncbi:MAG: M12 family metallopeptidase [Gammaproteobacteria bacterium]|nr:M12 family metallopeptidase [Gammaproteobacteria bacterium]